MGMRRGVIVMMPIIPVRDFPSGGQPNLVVIADVVQQFLEGTNSVGLTDQVGMQRNKNNLTRFCAFLE